MMRFIIGALLVLSLSGCELEDGKFSFDTADLSEEEMAELQTLIDAFNETDGEGEGEEVVEVIDDVDDVDEVTEITGEIHASVGQASICIAASNAMGDNVPLETLKNCVDFYSQI